MLVLTRNAREKLRTGDKVTISILNTKDNQEKIRIDARNEVTAHREEIYNQIQQEGISGVKIWLTLAPT